HDAAADPQHGVLAHQGQEPAEITAVPGIDEGPDDGLVGLELGRGRRLGGGGHARLLVSSDAPRERRRTDAQAQAGVRELPARQLHPPYVEALVMSDAELGSLARAGDMTALAGLLERCRPSLYATAVGLLGNRADALDAVQDTFVIALLRL